MAYVDLDIKGGLKAQRNLVDDLIIFALNELKLTRMNLEIKVKLCNPSNVDGFCMWEDDNVKPRQFTIEARKDQNYEDFCTTILHEMVHVKQYARGELKERYKAGHKQLWKNRDYTEADYLDQPWEKEAYKMQEILFKKFVKVNGA